MIRHLRAISAVQCGLLTVAVALSMSGCQTGPILWTDGTKVEFLSDGSFVISLASEKLASLGGPSSEKAQDFMLSRLKAKGCVPVVPIERGWSAWGGYWYATGKCQ
jgi:hypothetical protein